MSLEMTTSTRALNSAMTNSIPQEIQLPNLKTCWAVLERVAESSQLRRAPRLREFLFYVGRRSLREGCEQIHEQEIGIQVFGRPATYDTNLDNIVRVNATELRKRIAAYFESEGLGEPVILEIPRGSYTPVFRIRPADVPIPGETAKSEPVAAAEPSAAVQAAVYAPEGRRWMPAALVATALIALIFAGFCIALTIQVRSLQRSLYPWRYSQALDGLWSDFLNDNKDTDVIMADTSFSMIQGLRKHSYSFNEYLSRSYLSQSPSQQVSPDLQAALNLIGSKYLASADTFRLAQRIMALDPSGKKFHLYHAREYTPALINQHNVILIGGRIANPWEEIFDGQLNFTVTYDENGFPSIMNRAPAKGEPGAYSIAGSTGYSVAAYLPNPDGGGKVLILEGTTSESTEAAGDFLTSEDQLSNFQKMLQVKRLPYFDVLLKTSLVRGTPISATILAYRIYPNLR
jgi:hypothetical protein